MKAGDQHLVGLDHQNTHQTSISNGGWPKALLEMPALRLP
jgi:hypothetical protein